MVLPIRDGLSGTEALSWYGKCSTEGGYGAAEALRTGTESAVLRVGVVLPGGQRQRVALARALMKRAPILVPAYALSTAVCSAKGGTETGSCTTRSAVLI